jgi:hypothetical protein
MHFRSRAAAVRFAPGHSILFGVRLPVVGMSTTVPPLRGPRRERVKTTHQ